MKTFALKVREAREALNLTQQSLADLIGVSKRSVASYETGGIIPRGNTVRKLAKALLVSNDYLMNENIDDPKYGIEKSPYVEEVGARFGNREAKEIDELLERNNALFAGGAVSEEAKDLFFLAVMKAYLFCKEEAKAKYGKKKKGEGKSENGG
jgi:transcriptional regulator with XRE-family HTH domain